PTLQSPGYCTGPSISEPKTPYWLQPNPPPGLSGPISTSSERWNLPSGWQLLGALAILAHPAAFFLVAGYSESLFLMGLLGFLFWSGTEARGARILAAIHGIVMSATRIVGLPCALAPLVKRIWELGWRKLTNVRDWLANYGATALLSASAMLGGLGFFIY